MKTLVSIITTATLAVATLATPAIAGHYHHYHPPQHHDDSDTLTTILALGIVAVGAAVVIDGLDDNDRRWPPTNPSGDHYHPPAELIGPVDDCHWQPTSYRQHILVCG